MPVKAAPPQGQGPSAPPVSREDKRKLGDLILDKHPSGTQWNLLAFLVDESIAHPARPIGPDRVLGEDGCDDGPPSLSGVKSAASRLRAWLNVFFEKKEGYNQPFKVRMAKDGYLLFFEVNSPPPKPDDLVHSFWSPYITHERKTRVIYPEPLFFRDRDRTYFRNQRARSKHDIAEVFGPYLKDDRPLIRSFSFVPSGAVAAMVCLFNYFQKSQIQIPLAVSSIRPDAKLQYDDEHLIVLGSPGTLPHIMQLEGTLPLRTTLNGYWYKGREYLDGTQDDMGDPVSDFIKFAVLTRHRFGVSRERVVTVLSGAHGRSAEGLAGFLFDDAQLKTLAQKLSCDGRFPQSFQALFQVHMTKTDGEPEIRDVRVIRAIPEPRQGNGKGFTKDARSSARQFSSL